MEGIMITFAPRDYHIRELYNSFRQDEIILSPKFQRLPVWEYKAKSYLIDTILCGLPIPRIFIRERSGPGFTSIREIVDGQQRLRTIFDFIEDGFKISKVQNEKYGGLGFSDLPDNVKTDFLNYDISAVLLMDLTDEQISNIFARLNTYSIRLNNQELLNSQYFGRYKQLIYRLASEYRTFFLETGLLSEKNISRMEDAKLITDIVSVITTNKIESPSYNYYSNLYEKYDDEFKIGDEIENKLKFTIDLFSKIYSDTFKETSFTKLPLFYSTVLVLYHMGAPLTCFNFAHKQISEKDIPKIKTALDQINILVSDDEDQNKEKKEKKEVKEKKVFSTEENEFLITLKKNTTTPNVRMKRADFIGKKLLEFI